MADVKSLRYEAGDDMDSDQTEPDMDADADDMSDQGGEEDAELGHALGTEDPDRIAALKRAMELCYERMNSGS